MAVVGHAYVVVRALTDKVEGDIKRGFSGTSATSERAGQQMGNALVRGLGRSIKRDNSFTRLANQLRSLYPEAEQASRTFTSLMRRTTVLTVALGALAGSLGALVGGLGALAGAAGGAAASFVALGSAAVTLVFGIRVASFAMRGISEAVSQATKSNGGYSKSLKQMKFDLEEAALSITRAELNLERAREGLARVADLAPNNRLRREAELAVREAELALKKAKDAEKNPDTGGAGTDPFADLTPSQKQFAKFLVGLQPIFEELREAAAKGFLPILENQIKRLISAGFFKILERRFYDIGRAAGIATKNFTDIFLSGDNLRDFDTMLGNIARTLPEFGKIFGNAFDSFLSIMVAADPLTRRFVRFLESKSKTFANFLNTRQASGELTTFFNKAGDLAGMFGKIFGNVFGGFGSLIEANFGPGSGGYSLLEWLDKATSGWRNLDLIAQEKYFRGAADNFMSMGDAIGGAFESIIKQGSNPAIMDFWDTMDRGSFAFDQIIRASVNAAPALADFLRVMTEITALFTESKPMMVFFETLTFMLNGVREIMLALKPILDPAAIVFAFLSAIGLIIGGFTNLALVVTGFAARGLSLFAFLLPASMKPTIAALAGVTLTATGAAAATGATAVGLTAVDVAAKKATVAMLLFNASNPVGWVVLAVTALVGLGVALAGIKGAQMDKAVESTTSAFKKNASGIEVWKSATLAVNDATKVSIDSLDDMKQQLDVLGRGGRSFATTALADSFEAMGRSLGNIASTDLTSAQANFKKFRDQVGLSTKQVITALDEMDDYKKSLIQQADAMDISIRSHDGAIDKYKLAAFAVGEGEIAVRLAKQAQDEFNNSITEGAKSFVDLEGSLNQNKEEVKKWAKAQAKESGEASKTWKDYWDGQDFSMGKYLDDLQTQVDAAKNWRDNIAKLAGKLPEDVLNQVIAMGQAGADLVAGLTDGVNDEFEQGEITRLFGDAGFDASSAFVKGVNTGLSSGTSLRAILEGRVPSPMQKDGGLPRRKKTGFGYAGGYAGGGFVSGAGTARSDSIPAMLSNGEYVINARATAQNRTLLDAINSNKSVATAPTINMVINPSAEMNEKELAAEISRQLGFKIRRGGV